MTSQDIQQIAAASGSEQGEFRKSTRQLTRVGMVRSAIRLINLRGQVLTAK